MTRLQRVEPIHPPRLAGYANSPVAKTGGSVTVVS